MKVANLEKRRYKGEILTLRQWIGKGYTVKENEQPHRMWSNQMVCGSGNPSKFSYDYYYDYQVERCCKNENEIIYK